MVKTYSVKVKKSKGFISADGYTSKGRPIFSSKSKAKASAINWHKYAQEHGVKSYSSDNTFLTNYKIRKVKDGYVWNDSK